MRSFLHVARLAALAAGAASGVVVLVGYLVMLAGVARGSTPLPDLTVAQVALGVFVVLLWGAVTQAGLRSLYLQSRRSAELAAWVARNGRVPEPCLAAAAAARVAGRIVQVDDATSYAFTYGIWRHAWW